MADKIKGITVQIGADETPLRKALTSINKDIKATQSNLKEVEKLLKLDPTNTNLLREKQKLLADQIGKTTTKLDALKKAQEQAKQMLANGEIGQKEYENLENQIALCEKELGKLQEKQAETEKVLKPSAEKIGEAFQKVGEKIEEVGKKLAPLSGAAAAGLGIAVKTAKDWETAFTGVKKTVDGTDEDFEKIGAGIKDMATRTASSAEDIAGVAEVAGQLGVSTEDILTFTETMVKLGDTTNLSSTEAATALARFMNITGGSQKDVDKLGSAVVELGNNFATDEASIVNMSQKLASAGTIAGLSETDILALATAMSSVGIQAEAGGTAMTQSLDGIDKIVRGTAKDSGKKLQTLAKISGMSAEDFSKAWKKNPIKAIQAFIGGLGKLDGEGETATEVLDDLGMSGIRQGNMLKSLALASGVLTKAVQTSSGAYKENTALTNEANKRYDTFDAKLSQTKESAKQVAVEFGEVMLPVLKDLLDDIKGIIQWIKGLDDETKKTIVTVTAVVAALSPLLIIGGKLISGLGSIISFIPTITSFLTGIGGPITAIVAGVGLLTAGIIDLVTSESDAYEASRKLSDEQVEAKKRIDDQAEAWKNVEKSRSDAFKDIKDQTNNVNDLWKALEKCVDPYGKVVEGKEEEAKILIEKLNEALGTELEYVDGQISGYHDLASNIDTVIQKKEAEALLAADAENYAEATKNLADAEYELAQRKSDTVDAEKKVAAASAEVDRLLREQAEAQARVAEEGSSAEIAVAKLGEELDAAKDTLRGATDKLEELKDMQETAQETVDKYTSSIANHDKLVEAVANGSVADMREAEKDLANSFIDAEHGTKESLERQAKNWIEKYGNLRDIVKNTGDENIRNQSYAAGQMVHKTIEELAKLDPQTAKELKKVYDTINENGKSWAQSGYTNAKNFSGKVITAVSTLPGALDKKLDLATQATAWGKDMMVSYAGSIKKYSTLVKDAADNAAAKVHRVLGFSEPEEGPLSDFHTYGPDMMKLLAQGINSSEWEVVNAVQGVAGNIKAALQGTTVTAQLDQKSIPLSPGVTLNIANFNNYSDSDIRELTNEIMETAANFAARKGAVFA